MAKHGKIFDDTKEADDKISASKDWNPMARFLNSLLRANVVGLDATFSLDLVTIENPFNIIPVDLRICKITGKGTLNAGVGTYKAEALFLNKDDENAWLWDLRTDYHIKWDSEELGNSTSDLLILDDLYEINGTSGIENDTIVMAMKVQSLAGDKTNIVQYQWLFLIGGGGAGYDGPFAVTYDAVVDEFIVGATRSAANKITDIIISGVDDIEINAQETILRGANTDGYIYYELVGQGGAPFFNRTLKISNGGAVPAQQAGTALVFLARYFYDGSSVTVLRQLQRGNITIPGRW